MPKPRPKAEQPAEKPVTAFQEAETIAKRTIADRILRRNLPRMLTTTELGGPKEYAEPLIAGKYAAPPHLSLEGWLAATGRGPNDIMPGHDPGAVEEWRGEKGEATKTSAPIPRAPGAHR